MKDKKETIEVLVTVKIEYSKGARERCIKDINPWQESSSFGVAVPGNWHIKVVERSAREVTEITELKKSLRETKKQLRLMSEAYGRVRDSLPDDD